MPQKTNPRGKIVRRLGINVFGNPKYDRILRNKPNAPGKDPHQRSRKKISDYGAQLLEKQKVRFLYGLSEKQFRNTFYKAKKKPGETGRNLIEMLESRLDNTIYRLGWAVSREQARQMVNHKHFTVNGIASNIPSMMLNRGDRISVRDRKSSRSMIRAIVAESRTPQAAWLNSDNDNFTGEYLAKPSLAENLPPGDLQAIIEYYSR